MTELMCSPIIWWCLFGVLIGWLLNSLLVKRPVVHTQTTIQKPVERRVPVIKEVEVIKEIEKIIEKPIEIIKEIEVIKEVEKEVDNPALLQQIETLKEKIVSADALQATIELLEAKIKDAHTLAINPQSELSTNNSEESPADVENPAPLRRIKELEEELAGWAYRDVPINIASANAYGFTPNNNADLELILGIDLQIVQALNAAGILNFAQLAVTKVSDLKAILKTGGINIRKINPQSWPAQAALAAQNKWDELRIVHDAQLSINSQKKGAAK